MPPGRGGVRGSGRRFGGRRPRRPPDPTDVDAARGRAIGLLSRRDLPRAALKGRLTDAGFSPGAAESAVTGLEDERLVNDARYVEAAVASRIARGQGPLRIALELKSLGVEVALIAGALDPRAPEWAERAAALRRRRFGAAVPRERRQRARQLRFLLYRGFSGQQVQVALGTLGDEEFAELAAETGAPAPGAAADGDAL